MKMLTLLALLLASRLPAQRPALTRADSALVGRILLAEDRRDSTDGALAEGTRHADARVRTIAWRARARIRDPKFASRDSLPTPQAPMAWPEPAWRLRYRALTARRDDCPALAAAMADSSWPVRLRAADLTRASCAGDSAIVRTLNAWIGALPPDAASHRAGGVSWHPAAHAIVALARLRPAEAGRRLRWMAGHPQWQVRMYVARAVGQMTDSAMRSVLARDVTYAPDTGLLRTLARDRNDNVKEAAIEALSRLTGHASDDVYLAALGARGAQAVRAAALALRGSPHPDARSLANATFERWVKRQNASERDARVALLEAAGRPASDDRPPTTVRTLPPRAVALALGETVWLRVTMDPRSGGGAFVVRLRGDAAPVMAARILALVNRHYYDGLTWHRVEHDFVIQGGSPDDNEYVGAPLYLRDELGTVPHVRGTVGMSTRGHDTGDAQWFVNLKDNLRLGPDYTVFAEVVQGMDVVDRIMEGDRILRIAELRNSR